MMEVFDNQEQVDGAHSVGVGWRSRRTPEKFSVFLTVCTAESWNSGNLFNFTNVDFSLHFFFIFFFLKNIRNDETRRISGLSTRHIVKCVANEVELCCLQVGG